MEIFSLKVAIAIPNTYFPTGTAIKVLLDGHLIGTCHVSQVSNDLIGKFEVKESVSNEKFVIYYPIAHISGSDYIEYIGFVDDAGAAEANTVGATKINEYPPLCILTLSIFEVC